MVSAKAVGRQIAMIVFVSLERDRTADIIDRLKAAKRKTRAVRSSITSREHGFYPRSDHQRPLWSKRQERFQGLLPSRLAVVKMFVFFQLKFCQCEV